MSGEKANVSIPDCKRMNGLTKRTIHRALIVLVERKIIARTQTSGVYWINPTLFFRGDRMVLAREYIKEKRRTNGELETGEQTFMIPQAIPKTENDGFEC